MKLRKLTTYMSKREFVAGDSICYVDFILYELLELLDYVKSGKLFEENEVLEKYFARMNENG